MPEFITQPSLNYPQICSRLFNTPLLIEPNKADIIVSALSNRLMTGGEQVLQSPEPIAGSFYGKTSSNGLYSITDDGIAVISIHGSLVNRGSWIGARSGLVSYEALGVQLRKAADDDNIRGIVLDIDSPGGEVAGCFDVTALIREIREEKIILAIANDTTASAAYAIGSAASQLYVTQTSRVGSIGVLVVHLDYSKKLEDEGVRPSLIFSGDHKVDGNPFEKLPDNVRSDIQASIDQTYGIFVEAVNQNRPNLSSKKIKATEAKIYHGSEAVASGLADGVTTLVDLLAVSKELMQIPSKSKSRQGENAVADETQETSNTELNASVDLNKVKADAKQEAIEEEQKRIAAILSCDEAEGRTKVAQELAQTPGLSPDRAKAILSASAKDDEGDLGELLGGAGVASVETSKEETLSDFEQGKKDAEAYMETMN